MGFSQERFVLQKTGAERKLHNIKQKADDPMNKYPHLFEPIQIGTQTVKNRVFMPPISTNLANKCYVTDELVQHYGACAKGGVVRSKLAMRMIEKGIRIESGAKVTAVTEDTITFEKDGTEYVIRDADTLVFANGYHVDSTMEDMLKAAGAVYHLIGDGAKVGNIKDAISGAYEIARTL